MSAEENDQKQCRLSVRLSSDEMAGLRQMAEAQGLGMSDYVRHVLLQTKPSRSRLKIPPSLRYEFMQLLGRFGALGADINQLCRIASARGETPKLNVLEQSHQAIMATLEELRRVIR